jgi:hypothetical protein
VVHTTTFSPTACTRYQIWYRDFSDLKEHILSFKTQGRLHRLVVYGVCTIFSCTNVVLLEHVFLNRLQTG